MVGQRLMRVQGNEAAYLAANGYQDAAGIWRWRSNDRVPFDDLLTAAGVSAELRARCQAVRDEQTIAAVAAYRAMRAAHGYSAEEQAEMRAAFGPGHKVRDIFTGQEFNT
jgi:hypothetical protein